MHAKLHTAQSSQPTPEPVQDLKLLGVVLMILSAAMMIGLVAAVVWIVR